MTADMTRTGPATALATQYADLALEIDAVLDGEDDVVARMATVSAMLRQRFRRTISGPDSIWSTRAVASW